MESEEECEEDAKGKTTRLFYSMALNGAQIKNRVLKIPAVVLS